MEYPNLQIIMDFFVERPCGLMTIHFLMGKTTYMLTMAKYLVVTGIKPPIVKRGLMENHIV